ncbi:hypothetical protein WMY93_027804 [Mugilogobius chulae]|uniref:Uncharacterized protein n=1 Tax=Mugilogobius chulae TaxID=88201 RepID=A0AAW0MXF7_9GOBI
MCLHLQDEERNDDECWICRKEGTKEHTLVMCDDCPRSYHQECHLPNIQDALLRDDIPWTCALCVYNKTLELEMRAAMFCPISTRIPHCQYLLLSLYKADEDCVFKSDPCGFQKYKSVISTPMWFDKVSEKLENNRYNTVGEFVSDIQLIFKNCAVYNQGGENAPLWLFETSLSCEPGSTVWA